MPEPVWRLGEHSILINPDDPEQRRVWPNPEHTESAEWKAWHNPDALTTADLRALARAASAYRAVFSVSVRSFAPTHSAIRRALEEAALHPPSTEPVVLCDHPRLVPRLPCSECAVPGPRGSEWV